MAANPSASNTQQSSLKYYIVWGMRVAPLMVKADLEHPSLSNGYGRLNEAI